MRSEELADAYDTYAPGLYSYCRSVLRQPADAADAVHATFLIAAEKSDQLRDKRKFKSWLYAVARNECIRIFRTREIPIEQLPEIAEMVSMTEGSDKEYLSALVRDAAFGVNPAEREVLYLQLQGLEAEEQARTLGISRRHLASLASRARGQLEDSIGILLVARNGRQYCEDLDGMLTGWDGNLNPALRRRLCRHIRNCAVCGVRRQREMSPELLGAVVPMAFAVPAYLRDHVLSSATSIDPAAMLHRASIVKDAGAFGRDGFPRRLSPLKFRTSRARAIQASVAGTAVGGGVAAALVLSSGGSGLPGGLHVPEYVAQPPGPVTPSALHYAAPTPRNTRSTGPPLPRAAESPTPRSSATASSQLGGVVLGSPTPATSGTPSVSNTTAPASSATPAPASSPTPAPTRAGAAQGTITVTPTTLVLSPLLGSSFTITASGGSVSWSVSEGNGLLGSATVSPSSGTLQAGQSVTVSVTITSILSAASTLTVNPGGIVITVVAGVGL